MPALDGLDVELLQRLAQRVAMAAAESDAGIASDVETETLRQLLAAPHPTLRPQVLVRIWRELMAEARAQTAPIRLAIWGGKDPARTLDLARLRFGSPPEAMIVARPEAALTAAAAPDALAVLAVDGETPWWGRLLATPDLRVFAALPCLSVLGPTQALAVARIEPEPTGADETFWVTDAPGHAQGVVQALAALGAAAELVASTGGLRLFSLAGFYQGDDPRLARAPGRLTGVIGAAPAPLDV